MRYLLCVLLFCGSAHAGLISANNPGNDTEAKVSELVGKLVYESGRFDNIEFSDIVTMEESGSAIPNDLFFTTSASGLLTSGIDYDYFAVKAGNYFNLYSSDGHTTGWVTPFFKDTSHVTLYKCHMPEPSGLVLLGLGGLFFLRRCRT